MPAHFHIADSSNHGVSASKDEVVYPFLFESINVTHLGNSFAFLKGRNSIMAIQEQGLRQAHATGWKKGVRRGHEIVFEPV